MKYEYKNIRDVKRDMQIYIKQYDNPSFKWLEVKLRVPYQTVVWLAEEINYSPDE